MTERSPGAGREGDPGGKEAQRAEAGRRDQGRRPQTAMPRRESVGTAPPEGAGAGIPTVSAPESGASGFSIKRGARDPGGSRPPLAMSSSSDAVPDPEAPRPPAPPGRARARLPWVLSAALLLVAVTCAACAVRTWVLPGGFASPGPGPGPSPGPDSRLSEAPELLSEARARLPDSPQVRCAPTWDAFSIPHPGATPFCTPGLRSVPLRPLRAPLPYPGLRGNPFSSRYPCETPSAPHALGQDL